MKKEEDDDNCQFVVCSTHLWESHARGSYKVQSLCQIMNKSPYTQRKDKERAQFSNKPGMPHSKIQVATTATLVVSRKGKQKTDQKKKKKTQRKKKKKPKEKEEE